MRLGDILLSALRGVTANKLRSILTMLGVLIGVAAVILLLAVGNGSAQTVNSLITSLGTNTLTIRSTGGEATGSSAITLAVSEKLDHAGLGHVRTVVPESTTSLTVSSTNASETGVSIIGTTADYFRVATERRSPAGARSPHRTSRAPRRSRSSGPRSRPSCIRPGRRWASRSRSTAPRSRSSESSRRRVRPASPIRTPR
ncbi:MAG: ABC transporter permease [Galbitalea sp.]